MNRAELRNVEWERAIAVDEVRGYGIAGLRGGTDRGVICGGSESFQWPF